MWSHFQQVLLWISWVVVGSKEFDLPMKQAKDGRFNKSRDRGFLTKVGFFSLLQVTYKWLSYTLGVHVNQAKQ